ncbi:MAG: hypothetical protein LKJ25_04435 [Clostridia bacterium]|jgi:hypothetical protein|nr:hypothetical protein [Clostridia bacterium]
MRFVKDGIEYVTGMDAVEEFYVSNSSCLASYRRYGMPFYIFDKATKRRYKLRKEKYFYPVRKCRKWFAGEE